MEIVSKIVKENKVSMYVIKDGSITYPILKEALWVPSIIDTLIKDGYVLRGLPFDIVSPSGNPIDNLPEISYEEAGIDDIKLMEMNDMLIERYSREEMSSKITVEESSADYLPFKKKGIVIKTREELIDFLKTRESRYDDAIDIRFLYPINAFTADEALLTPAEYTNPDNVELVSLLEKYRTLTFAQFRALVKAFREDGLRENYTAKEFIDMYMSFGIPGINTRCLAPKETQEEYIMGAEVNYQAVIQETREGKKDKSIPYNLRTAISYVTAFGEVHKTAVTEHGEWELQAGDAYKIATALRARGEEYIQPVVLETRASKVTTYLEGPAVTCKYDEDNMELTIGGRSRISTVLKVLAPGSKRDLIPSTYYNIFNNEYEKNLQCSSLVAYIVENTTVRTSASTFNALRTVGASPLAVLNYFLNHDDNSYEYSINPIDSEGDVLDVNALKGKKDASGISLIKSNGGLEPQEFLILIKQYLDGNLTQEHRLFATIEYLLLNLFNGTLNMDGVANGYKNDKAAKFNNSKYYTYMVAVQEFLGLSFQDIYSKVANINVDTKEIVFEGNGLKVAMPITPVDSAATAYDADVKAYRSKQAQEATLIGTISTVYSELSTTRTFNRHVAVDGYLFDITSDAPRSKEIKYYIQKLTNWCIDVLKNNYAQTDARRNVYVQFARECAVNGILGIYFARRFKMYPIFSEPTTGKEGIILDFSTPIVRHPLSEEPEFRDERIDTADLLNALSENIIAFHDTTTNVSDYTINAAGRFITYFNNAIITPEYVLPKDGFNNENDPILHDYDIAEVAFRVAWYNIKNGSEKEQEEDKALFTDKQYLPPRDIRLLARNKYSCLRTRYEQYPFPIHASAGSRAIKPVKNRVGNLFEYMAKADEEIISANNTGTNIQYPTHPAEIEYAAISKLQKNMESYANVLTPIEQEGELIQGRYYWRMFPCQKLSRSSVLARSKSLADLVTVQSRTNFKALKIEDFEGFTPSDYLEVGTEKLIDSLLIDTTKELALFVDYSDSKIFFTDNTDVNITEIPRLYSEGKYNIAKLSNGRYLVHLANKKMIEVRL